MPTVPRISRSSGRRSPRPVGPLARSRSASAGRLYPDVPGARGLADTSRARGGLPRIVVRRLASGEEHVIAFAEEAYSLGIDGGYEFATNLLRFTYSSMTTPEEIWDYDLASRNVFCASGRTSPAATTAPTTSRDGCSRPPPTAKRFRFRCFTARMSPRRHRALPALWLRRLWHVDPRLVQQQPVVAGRPRLRLRHRACAGGSEKGWRWYREGKLAKKMNTFTDFIAASEYLSKNGWCAPGMIVAEAVPRAGT
jgi:Protease II